MILKVSRLGHPVLRQKSEPAKIEDIRAGKFRQLVEDMIETMHAYEGIGLAGPQVHLPLQIFVYEVQDHVAKRRGVDALKAGVMFNGSYEPVGDEQLIDWEGCLSIPFLGGEVPRYRKLRVKGVDANGDPIDIVAQDFTARIFQHEIDHTEGHVYVDRMPDLKTLGYTIVL